MFHEAVEVDLGYMPYLLDGGIGVPCLGLGFGELPWRCV